MVIRKKAEAPPKAEVMQATQPFQGQRPGQRPGNSHISRREEVEILNSASIFSRVINVQKLKEEKMIYPKAFIKAKHFFNNLETFRISEISETPFNITQDLNIIYVAKETWLKDYEKGHSFEISIEYEDDKGTVLETVTVSVKVKEDERNMSACVKEYFCDEYSYENECNDACAEGAKGGFCTWLTEEQK